MIARSAGFHSSQAVCQPADHSGDADPKGVIVVSM
jgi:hypothetical protein